MAWGLLFEQSMLAYNHTTNRAEWIPMWGSASDLSPVEEASAQELSNIVLHDPTEVTRRMDHFGEQRHEGSAEEATAEALPEGELVEDAMELGYQPGSVGEADSDSTDSPPSPGHIAQSSSSRHCYQSSVSWVDECPSETNGQHMPGSTRGASPKTIEESEGEVQPTQPASLRDEDEPVEGSTVSGQESLDTNSIGGNPPSDSQEEVIIHMKEEEIDSLCWGSGHKEGLNIKLVGS